MSKVIRALRESGQLASSLRLIDVGCSGGFYRALNGFRPGLAIDAFDPLVREVERLREKAPDFVSYHDAFVVSDDLPKEDGPSNSFQQRTYAVAFKRAQKFNAIKERFNSGMEIAYSSNRIMLDRFVGDADIDFLKVDTDGHDFEVLHGAKQLLARKQIVGVAVEVRFTGRQTPHANLWRNIDRLLCENGLSLFDVTLRRYARASLPSPFLKGPGPTKQGQANWGDALYLRDLGAPDYERDWGVDYTPDKIAKAIGVMAAFGYADCALEILEKYADLFGQSRNAIATALGAPKEGSESRAVQDERR